MYVCVCVLLCILERDTIISVVSVSVSFPSMAATLLSSEIRLCTLDLHKNLLCNIDNETLL